MCRSVCLVPFIHEHVCMYTLSSYIILVQTLVMNNCGMLVCKKFDLDSEHICLKRSIFELNLNEWEKRKNAIWRDT